MFRRVRESELDTGRAGGGEGIGGGADPGTGWRPKTLKPLYSIPFGRKPYSSACPAITVVVDMDSAQAITFQQLHEAVQDAMPGTGPLLHALPYVSKAM